MPNYTHYKLETQGAEARRYFSVKAAQYIVRTLKYGTHPGLIYTGMSGTSLATSVADRLYARWRIQPNMYYIRKENEVSHGLRVEIFSNKLKDINLFFIDDFISTGGTLSRVLKALHDLSVKTYRDDGFDTDDDIFSRDLKSLKIIGAQTPSEWGFETSDKDFSRYGFEIKDVHTIKRLKTNANRPTTT